MLSPHALEDFTSTQPADEGQTPSKPGMEITKVTPQHGEFFAGFVGPQ